MKSLPTGTVTFLFTDIEGSTRLLQQLGDRYADVLATHHRLLRAAIQDAHGHEMDSQGDALFAAFPRAREALLAAVAAQRALQGHPWPDGIILRVRMGLHTGEPISAETGYVGMDVHRATRICAAAHGGQILLSDTTSPLVTKDLPDGMSLRDLGEHRLKDLAHPHCLFQVVAADLAAEFPPIRSLDVLPNNLPRQLTSFIGRENEIAEVKRLLSTAYLVTLTGSGGAGKTRLALQVAADVMDEHRDGVWLVEFAPITDSALVPKTVASALNVPEQPGRAMADTLVDALRPKALMLVLDNCEHLVAACAHLAETLLRACPHVRILATSRESIGIKGEIAWRVPSLAVPDPQRPPTLDRFTEYEAVRLFVERATASAPWFTVTSSNAPAVARVCHGLDGIPLAIELAAARVKVLPVEQIAGRLDDRFRLLTGGSRTSLPRQQTLRAAMDWSYDLLAKNERTLLRRVSVFAGGWTLEASESVCAGDGVEASDILDLLTQLVDKSLVVAEIGRSEARYLLLETVRQYGLNKLLEAGEAVDVRRRHRDWFLALAEQAEPDLRDPKRMMCYDRLETEHDNLRTALEWAMTEGGGRREALRLAVALSWFWRRRGHWTEASEWTEQGLRFVGDVEPSLRAKALASAATLAWRVGKDERAIALAKEGLAFSRGVGDREQAAWSLMVLGWVARQRGDYEQAKRSQVNALSLSSGLDDRFSAALALTNLGAITRDQGDYEQATALHEQALAMARAGGDIPTTLTSLILNALGMDYLFRGAYKQATEYYAQSLTMCKETGDRWIPVLCLYGLGDIACARQQYKRAARLFGAGNQLNNTLGPVGYRFVPSDQECHERYTATTRARLGESACAASWAEGRAMTLEQAVEYALTDQTT